MRAAALIWIAAIAAAVVQGLLVVKQEDSKHDPENPSEYLKCLHERGVEDSFKCYVDCVNLYGRDAPRSCFQSCKDAWYHFEEQSDHPVWKSRVCADHCPPAMRFNYIKEELIEDYCVMKPPVE